MVSGFVIYWTLEKVKDPMDFIVSRFSRLYPIYWASAIITFLTVSYFGLSGREVPVIDALMNILMFHQYLNFKHIDGVYWTLTIELTFYVWIFTIYKLNLLNYAEYILCPLVILSIVNTMGYIETSYFIENLLMLKFISFFISGICFFKITNKTSNKKTFIVMLICLFSTIIVNHEILFILFTMFYTLFYCAVSGRLKFLDCKPLLFFGSISYSLYLIHQNIGFIIINELYSLGSPLFLSQSLYQ
jgi:peptidoglycan/LPS O-acetylase OafA/YrhL